MSSGSVQFNPKITEYKLPQNFGFNVGGVSRGAAQGISGTKYVEGETGDRIAYTDNRGYVGCMGETAGSDQAGYHHTRPMREVCVA